jgi:hypothetical protein
MYLPLQVDHRCLTQVAAVTRPPDGSAQANLVVDLRHCEGGTVRARMSNASLMRHDDPVRGRTSANAVAGRNQSGR